MTRNKLRLEIIFSFLLILIVFIAGSIYIYYRETNLKPIIKDKINSKDYSYLYNFYINQKPSFENIPVYGHQDAPINIIAYIDITSGSSRYFFSDIFNRLKENYIDLGLVNFYIKSPLTKKDFDDKNEKYIYAKTLQCVKTLKKDEYYPAYFSFYKLKSTEEIKNMILEQDIPEDEYNQCMAELDLDSLKELISETENNEMNMMDAIFYIGVDGINFQSLYGIPSYNKFNSTIKDFEVLIGN